MDSQDHDRWIGSDVGQQGCERIKFNEDYKDKQVDENGREYIDYWTCGGPCVVVIWYRSTPTTTQYILGALSGDSIKED